jgi:hypothetical protein
MIDHHQLDSSCRENCQSKQPPTNSPPGSGYPKQKVHFVHHHHEKNRINSDWKDNKPKHLQNCTALNFYGVGKHSTHSIGLEILTRSNSCGKLLDVWRNIGHHSRCGVAGRKDF